MAVNTSAFRGRPRETYGTKSGITGGTTTLTVGEAMVATLKFTGAVATAATIIFPLTADDAGLMWWVDNATTNGGSSSVTFAGPGPTTGIAAPAQAKKALILWDGTDFVALTADK